MEYNVFFWWTILSLQVCKNSLYEAVREVKVALSWEIMRSSYPQRALDGAIVSPFEHTVLQLKRCWINWHVTAVPSYLADTSRCYQCFHWDKAAVWHHRTGAVKDLSPGGRVILQESPPGAQNSLLSLYWPAFYSEVHRSYKTRHTHQDFYPRCIR